MAPPPALRASGTRAMAAPTRRCCRPVQFAFALAIAGGLLAAGARVAAAASSSAEAILASVLQVRAKVPATARTAKTLGSERRGNGVVIADPGVKGGLL